MTKPITISVPDELSAELKTLPEIKVSAVCQMALKNEVEGLKSKNVSHDELLSFAEERFTKQLKKEMDEYLDICITEGEKWAAKFADFEELKKLCEGKEGDEHISLDHVFFELREGILPEEIIELDGGSNQLSEAFADGVMTIWEKIKERMVKKGYSEYFK
jgi:hypothetical protein